MKKEIAENIFHAQRRWAAEAVKDMTFMRFIEEHFVEKDLVRRTLIELRDHDSIVLSKDAIRYIENKLQLR